MLTNLLFSINAVLPVFLLVGLGWLLKKTSFLPDAFYSGSEKFVFKIGLPCMLFLSVANSTAEHLANNIPLVIFCSVSIVTAFFLLVLTVPLFVKDNDKRGAFIQGAYRSNFGILGLPLAANLFGAEGTTTGAILMPAAILFFNVLAVVILTVYAPNDLKKSPSVLVKDITLSVITNPLIIAVVLGLPFLFFDIELPLFVSKTTNELSSTVSALALISLGAGFKKEAFVGRLKYSLVAAAVKTAVIPSLAVIAAALCGLRGVGLGLVFILFGSPTAVSSYIMAKNMKSDHEMAGQILLLSTLMCLFTLFLGIFLLRTVGLI